LATFFTRITLDEISSQGNEKFKGKFTIDIEELNISREFTFIIINQVDSSDCVVLIYKDNETFLAHIGRISINNLEKHKPEEGLILMSFGIIFLAHKDRLNPNKYALTKIIRNSQKISVTTATPDFFRNIFTRACL